MDLLSPCFFLLTQLSFYCWLRFKAVVDLYKRWRLNQQIDSQKCHSPVGSCFALSSPWWAMPTLGVTHLCPLWKWCLSFEVSLVWVLKMAIFKMSRFPTIIHVYRWFFLVWYIFINDSFCDAIRRFCWKGTWCFSSEYGILFPSFDLRWW